MSKESRRKSGSALPVVAHSATGGSTGALQMQRVGADCNAGPTAQLLASLREHAPLLAAVSTFIVACLGVRFATGHPDLAPINDSTMAVGWRYLFVAFTLPMGYHLVHFMSERWKAVRESRDADPLVAHWTRYRKQHFSIHRVAGLFITCLALAALLSTFWSFKKVLPVFSPFVWDSGFTELDRVLHFGEDPWALLQPVLGHPMLTIILDRLYYVWFLFIPLMIAWQGWSRNRQLRAQFLLSYALCWILLGMVMAYWFSSAGPCYYAEVVGEPNPFAPLMAYLTEVNGTFRLNALLVQEWLWSGYVGQEPFEGISAMPSMHVSLPVLYALVGFRVHRWLGAGMAAYAFVILLGSIHLGWHYAVDGYVAALATIIIWWAVGFFVGKDGERFETADAVRPTPRPG